ncbi:hypothetical protein CLV71_103648 [Actinophytocola oryzae]|uniref:Uncharacterized protein n=1 Tax=Actinophytocola oryzae TaxID=502181 RepID=A0A4R7W1I2_9PSEU|nr:hypothetical protein CLV71_103648 [Actinophytocola oryzae]
MTESLGGPRRAGGSVQYLRVERTDEGPYPLVVMSRYGLKVTIVCPPAHAKAERDALHGQTDRSARQRDHATLLGPASKTGR